MKHTYNLSTWLNRLGIKGGAVPTVLEAVQPVQVVGDASLLVPQLRPPTGLVGGTSPAAAGIHGALQLQSLAKGGTMIRSVFLLATNQVAFDVSDVPFTFAASGSLTPSLMSSDPVSSIVLRGEVTAANAVDPADNAVLDTTYSIGLYAPFWIAPGRYFRISAVTANTIALWFMIFEDLPAAAGPE